MRASAILDPPRAGLGKHFDAIASSLEKLGVQKGVAVGCDPDSWLRDLSKWLNRGWKLERVALFDLFPQTYHLESVALIVRT
jgi:23S rRNA (uracil1939-C5)-methyltransferase